MTARKPRSKKAKGTRLEKWVAGFFGGLGWKSRRQPGSGVYQDFSHDVWTVAPNGQGFLTECKSWKHGWRTGDNALGKADILVIKRDYGEPCVYMPAKTFGEILAMIPVEGREAAK